MDQLNRLLEAAAVLDGFEFWRQFKDGELVSGGQVFSDGPLAPGLLANLVQQCAAGIGALAPADFNRAKAAADRFLRPEVRTMAHLALAQQALSKQADGPQAIIAPTARRDVVFIR